MTNPKEQKKFEARIAQDLWDEYEAWVGARVSVTNTQLLSGLLRLFLLAPEVAQGRVEGGRSVFRFKSDNPRMFHHGYSLLLPSLV